jgi:protein phosphatase
VNTQLKQGVITEEEARESEQRNIITRAVGTAEKVKADIGVFSVGAGDRFLLCSDGLTDMVDDDVIAEMLGRGDDIQTTARMLVDAANAAGGRDNTTVVLAESE